MKTTTAIIVLVIAIGALLAYFPVRWWIDSHTEKSSTAGVSAVNRGTIKDINGRTITLRESEKEYFVPESAEILEDDRAIEFKDLEVGDRVEIRMEQEIKIEGEEWKEGELEVVKIRVIG
jgi:hypothetical protein